MNLRLVKTPRFIQWLFPERIWAFPFEKNSVYLTFDDGPIPEITPWVLDELKRHDAKATFFCIGENVQKNPAIFNKIINEGHSVGNHTFNHVNGWKTETSKYIENVEKTEKQIWGDGSWKLEDGRQVTDDRSWMTDDRSWMTGDGRSWMTDDRSWMTGDVDINSLPVSTIKNRKSLFRPPYGKITSKQAKILQKNGFKIVMWDIISYDFDASLSEEKCLQNVLQNIKPGSIVVFHDSLKAEKNLRYVLPKVLEFIGRSGLLYGKI